MAAGRIVIPNYMPALDLNGNPLGGARITFYLDKTTTLAPTYADETLTVPHPNPVIAGADGVFPTIFADITDYFTVAITDAAGAPIGGLRNLDGIQSAGAANYKADLDGSNVEGDAFRGAIGSFPTRALAMAKDFSTGAKPSAIRIDGYAAAGDGGGALYKPVASQPAHTGKLQSLDGQWWEIAEPAVAPRMIGAAGDGVTNDRAALLQVADAAGTVTLPAGQVFSFGNLSSGAEDPLFRPYGAGRLKWNGVELGGYTLDFDVGNESIWSTPDSWFKATRTGASVSPEYPPYAPPGRGDLTNIFNTVISQRSRLQYASLCQNVTAYGANIGVLAHEWMLTDAFGADAMMFAYLSDRNTALGTETMVWLGAPNRQYLIDTNHDFYRNTPPNAWTAGNNELEALHPGIGMRIYNYANYPTDRSQVTANTAAGRDALCHLVRGENNVASGYQSAVMLWEGSENVAYGALSLRNLVFGSNNTALGNRALQNANDTNQATAVGYGAMRSAKTASNAVGIGYLCGDGVENTVGALLLGTRAGAGHGGSLQNKWVLGNVEVTTRNPAVSGDFTTGRMGVNIPIGAERSNLHVRVGAGSGSAQAQEAGLLVEGPGLVALSMEGPAGGTTAVNFGVAGSPTAGRIEYAGGSNQLLFKTNGAFRARLTNDGTFRPETDNAQPLGVAAQRWSVVYAGTGTINTSDARQKTEVRSLTEAEVAAASDLAREIGGYRFLSAIVEKGEGARTHIGMTVQRAIEIMQGHDLDPCAYGFICHDAWEAWSDPALYDVVEDRGEDGELLETRQVLVREEVHHPAGDVYSFRPDEFLMFMAKGFDARLSQVEAILAAV